MQNKPPVEFDQAITYVNKIKQRFTNDERVYKAFLEILNMYRKGLKTITNVYEEVALLFRNHNDLLAEFTYFLPDNNPPAAQPRRPLPPPRRQPGYGPIKTARRAPPPLRRDDPKVQREIAFFDKVKNRLRNKDAYTDFLKCLNLFAEDVISKQELVSLVQDIIGSQHDLIAGLNEFLLRAELGPDDPYSRPYQARDRSRHTNVAQKYISLPISELEVNTWERTTPSYVLLPTSYPRLKASGRDPVTIGLLNDEWVSVTSGSEDYNFKHYRKNQYEDSLFMAEDDHFELDMIIDQNHSAIVAMQPLADEIAQLDEEEKASWQMPEGALRAFHYRAVHRIYADAGPRVVAYLKQTPVVAIPVILPRLIQKDEEWRKTKAELMGQWQAIFKENYNKSLDHRSFYFKQSEKKFLTPKQLFSDLKDVADRRKNEKVSVLLALNGRIDFAARVSPHLSAEYTEVDVQLDASHIIQMGIDNMLTADAAKKVRALHHSFMETFFNLKCTCGDAEERRKKGAAADAADAAAEGRDPIAPTGSTPRAVRAASFGKTRDGGETTDGGEDDEEEGGLAVLKGLASGLVAGPEAETSDDDGADRINDGAPDAMVTGEDGVGAEKDGAGEEGGEEDEEPANQSEYISCRPIAPLVSAMAATQEKPSTPTAAAADGALVPHCRVFYGNESLYVLFRLHQILYERLRTARQCAKQKAEEGPKDAAALHKEFMDMVESLIEGRMDPSIYEDDCRALLGTNSYQLFTIDKLVQKLVKHAQACLGEEPTARLVDLWKYENSRGLHVMDGVYYANARVILVDEPAIRFEHTHDRMLNTQYMEGEKCDVPPVLEPSFRKYIETYVDGELGPPVGTTAPDVESILTAPGVASGPAQVPAEVAVARVCLKKNLTKVGPAAKANGDWEASMAEILSKAVLSNGLECKLGSTAQQRVKKIAYVLGTEDYFLSKRRRVGGNGGGRVAKFNAWFDSQGGGECVAATS